METQDNRQSLRRSMLLGAALAGSSMIESSNAASAADTERCAVRSGLVKHVGFVARKPGLTMEEFTDHWLNKHAVVAKRMPGILRYAINIIDRSRFPNYEYDGFSEVWFASEEARLAAFASPEGKWILADVPNFVGTRLAIVTTENQLV